MNKSSEELERLVFEKAKQALFTTYTDENTQWFLRRFLHDIDRYRIPIIRLLLQRPTKLPFEWSRYGKQKVALCLDGCPREINACHMQMICCWAVRFAPELVRLDGCWKQVLSTLPSGIRLWNRLVTWLLHEKPTDDPMVGWADLPWDVQRTVLELL